MKNNSEILIYQNPTGEVRLDVRLEEETVWLTQAHLCELFQKSKATISEHVKHIFEEGELVEESVVRNFRTTAKDGKNYDVRYYNLDVIISVGYQRTDSSRTGVSPCRCEPAVDGDAVVRQARCFVGS